VAYALFLNDKKFSTRLIIDMGKICGQKNFGPVCLGVYLNEGMYDKRAPWSEEFYYYVCIVNQENHLNQKFIQAQFSL
jgi:hypothetical protein